VEIAETLRTALEGDETIAFAVLFGSFAKGNAHASSDVDVAVMPSRELTLEDEAALASHLERATGRTVDLVRLDRTEDFVLRREVALGLPVWELRRGAFARFRAEAVVAWLDFEPVYTQATQLYLRRVAEGIAPTAPSPRPASSR
jgi:predicted nucleotidyltransferase